MFDDDLLELLESLFADDEVDDSIVVLNSPIIPFFLGTACCSKSYSSYSS